MPDPGRPTPVSLLVTVKVIGSIIPITVGALMLSGDYSPETYLGISELLQESTTAYPALIILAGLVGLAAARGLWTAKTWAWTLALTITIIGITMSVVAIPPGTIQILLDTTALYLLFRPEIKAFCHR
jgi:hypothetical protein